MDNEDQVSISQFSIEPQPIGSGSSTVTFKPGTIGSNSSDSYMKSYLKSTAKWRRTAKDLKFLHDRKKANAIIDAVTMLNIKELDSTKQKYEPTYQLEPKKKLNFEKVEETIRGLLSNFIQRNILVPEMMSANHIKQNIEHITALIKNQIKSYADKRHKILVKTLIVEDKHQGFIFASNGLLDPDRDFCVSVCEKKRNHVFIVNAYFIYHD